MAWENSEKRTLTKVTNGENRIEPDDVEKISVFEEKMKDIMNIETEVDVEMMSIEQLPGEYPAWVISALDFMLE